MPAYENTQPPYSVARGDVQAIVNAQQLGSGNFSERVAIAQQDGNPPGPLSLSFSYASTPSSVEYDVYVSVDDTIAPGTAGSKYIKIGSTTNVNGDLVAINTLAGGYRFRFLCVKEVTSPGVNATVKVQQ